MLSKLYQPLQQLSVDEHMVKSKARSGGFKFWVLADSTGFTSDCSLYCEKQRGRPICDNELAFDVMWSLTSCMHLIIRGIQCTSTTGTLHQRCAML